MSSSPYPDAAHESLDSLMPVLYQELRAVARRQLRLRAAGGTLSTTGLVHEAYLKLAGGNGSWQDRSHFMALAALAMRHVLVDRAKARLTQKRDGNRRRVTLEEALVPSHDQPEVLLDLSDAIDRIAADYPRLAQVIDCRFFGGFNDGEIAEAMGVTPRTVQRDWMKARVLLRRALAL